MAEPRSTEGPDLINTTDAEVVVFVDTRAAGEVRAMNLGPGSSGIYDIGVDNCTKSRLIARTPDGDEVDRIAAGLCDGESWEIAEPG